MKGQTEVPVLFSCEKLEKVKEELFMRDFSNQSSFSRTLYNDAKLGAYYTDAGHTERMGRMIRLLGETSVLEPCCGDASALAALLKTAAVPDGKKVNTYGVEMQKSAADLASKTMDRVLWADFLNGVKITKNAFSLCFTNPPYGEKESKTERLETDFIEAIYPLMAADGLMVAVLPFQVFKVSSFLRALCERFEFGKEDVYRFDDREYARFHQLAVFARRRQRLGYRAGEYEAAKEIFASENPEFPYLPKLSEEPQKLYRVKESFDEKIETFAPLQFDAEAASAGLSGSSLYRRMRQLTDNRVFHGLKLGNPPAPLKKDLLYLTAVAGGGQGKAGSVEDGTFHLQRGTVKPVTEVSYLTDGKGNVIGTEERTHSQITMNIIEPSGRCTSLIGADRKEEDQAA